MVTPPACESIEGAILPWLISDGRPSPPAGLGLPLSCTASFGVERPPLLRIGVLVDDSRVAFDLQRIDSASDLSSDLSVQPDDLRDVGPLELRP